METTTTTRGTCPICFGDYVVDDNGTIHRHGWMESGGRRLGEYGNATQHGDCDGSGEKPFEVCCEVTKKYIRSIVFPRTLLTERAIVSADEKDAKILSLQLGHFKRLGTFLCEKVQNWQPQELRLVVSGPVVHSFHPRVRQRALCGVRSYTMVGSWNADEVTCTKCKASLASATRVDLVDAVGGTEAWNALVRKIRRSS